MMTQEKNLLLRTLMKSLSMVYDRMGDGDRYSYKTFSVEGPRFHTTSH